MNSVEGFNYLDTIPITQLSLPRKRYEVTTAPVMDPTPDQVAVVYTGISYNRAVEVCNFWDDRQPTWIEEIVPYIPRTPLQIAMWRFDQLSERIDRMARRPF